MNGNNGLWLAFPQRKGEQDGETKWFDQVYFTKPEAEHVRRLVITDLQRQGHIQAKASAQQRPAGNISENEGVSAYYSNGVEDDIPF